jgi:hypothetical protein
MADYRLYCLERDGRIGFAEWFQAENHEQAIVRAREMKPDAQRCEVWNDRELIAVLDASGIASSA